MVRVGVAVLCVAGLTGCCPPVACVRTLTVEFADAAGNALAPKSLTGATPDCAVSVPAVTCTANSIIFEEGSYLTTLSLSAVATTGEVFDGSVTPTWTPTRTVAPGSCGCSGDTATVKLTLVR